MPLQPILQGDIPELRAKTAEVISFDITLTNLLDDLRDTLIAQRGLGLSAPQIGVLKKVIVIDLGEGTQEYVNPVILAASEAMVEGYESCLSFPDHTLRIARPKTILICAKDRFGQPFQLQASGLLARVICHEIDHLNGILFMDNLSEDELFSQLLDHARWSDEADADEEMPETLRNAFERQARIDEMQLAIDMLSDATWKLTLAIEILKDYETEFSNSIDWHRLMDSVELLDKTIEVAEQCVNPPDA